jgi:hypothetical protein
MSIYIIVTFLDIDIDKASVFLHTIPSKRQKTWLGGVTNLRVSGAFAPLEILLQMVMVTKQIQ